MLNAELLNAKSDSRSNNLVMPPLQVLEARVLLDEGHFDASGGTVSLLADDELCDPSIVRSRVVLLFAENEDYEVCILLERARFAEV